MANISSIKIPNGTTYTIKDKNALPLTGGSVTGPVSFGDSITVDEATIGDLVVNGSGSFTNNLQANTINGYSISSAASNNTIALRTANGYLFATYFNQSSGAETPTTSSYIMYANSDGYLRKSTLANVKSILGLGSAAYTESSSYATSGHTHTTSIATSTATNQITLAYGTKYAITAGGTSYVFTMPSSDNTNTTYTFTNGTNGFTVTPSGGNAQTVTVTPSITNNVTGSGTSGQLAQWNGANTLTNGPKVTISTSTPSGGTNGDIWFVYS